MKMGAKFSFASRTGGVSAESDGLSLGAGVESNDELSEEAEGARRDCCFSIIVDSSLSKDIFFHNMRGHCHSVSIFPTSSCTPRMNQMQYK